jgi:hypothetical protein
MPELVYTSFGIASDGSFLDGVEKIEASPFNGRASLLVRHNGQYSSVVDKGDLRDQMWLFKDADDEALDNEGF